VSITASRWLEFVLAAIWNPRRAISEQVFFDDLFMMACSWLKRIESDNLRLYSVE
jgi:hypothetical protein